MNEADLKYYSRAEELLNIATHGLGLVISIVALVLLIIKATRLEYALLSQHRSFICSQKFYVALE